MKLSILALILFSVATPASASPILTLTPGAPAPPGGTFTWSAVLVNGTADYIVPDLVQSNFPDEYILDFDLAPFNSLDFGVLAPGATSPDFSITASIPSNAVPGAQIGNTTSGPFYTIQLEVQEYPDTTFEGFDGSPLVTSNFVAINIANPSVTAAPESASRQLFALGLAALSAVWWKNRTRKKRRSSNA